MKTILLALSILTASSAFGQEQQLIKQQDGPPPTVDQCRADMSAWIDQTTSEALATLPYQEVMRRASEMSLCKKIDPKDANTSRWQAVLRTSSRGAGSLSSSNLRTQPASGDDDPLGENGDGVFGTQLSREVAIARIKGD